MKPNITPIDHEVVLADNEFIVSKTDTKGIITYVNRTFMAIAGYAEAELLGKQHNIIRHPDMPRGAFQLLWNTLQQGEEFFGYVKNLCKDGSYYWVFVNVTPDFDTRGQLRGYYSARRKPSRLAINTIKPIYQEMLQIENNSSTKEAIAHSLAYLNDTLHSLNTSYPHLILSLNKTEEHA
ncbi:PAS domain-containing protein [Neptunomonas qingdaonensis]|uniref:PAS domain S-box-containing protein n=1 Tax=Neptunomonas qingdaonensis TaxID=1045558 RepID=A0A1I2P993_9GAMM|nr:PAS domain-containing protein [Neptunomonas qingdaonensis]SFG12060.1 PAS domain S-box-containing protein [Neptunomonas qingdaonensis]